MYLYFRMIFVILTNLYVSRIILEQLGIEDFGIYTLVGGLVSFLAIFQSVMASAVSRFFTIAIGKRDFIKLKKYFNISFIIYLLIALSFLIICETIGMWFLENKLIIPNERTYAARYVFHFSVLSFLLGIISVPYSSIIIAHEKMNLYALIGILESIIKLFITFIIVNIEFDKLIFYSICIAVISLINFLINYLYCFKKFIETRINWFWDWLMFKELFLFSVWSLFGSISSVARNQGINLILGIFFNPAINAARGIATQVSDGITQLSNNFFTAVRPQIIKQFASNEKTSMLNLVFRSSKFSFYLLLIIVIPVFFETKFLFEIWLVEIPQYAVLFTRIVLITALIDTLSYPLISAINANGDIKWYQIVTGSILILTLPISYVFLKLGYPAETPMYIALVISIVAQFSRISFVKYFFRVSMIEYFKNVLGVILIVFCLCLFIPSIIYLFIPHGIFRFIMTLIISLSINVLIIYFIGFDNYERNAIKMFIQKKFLK